MYASELIEELVNCIARNGDVIVVVSKGDGSGTKSIKEVHVDTIHLKPTIRPRDEFVIGI